MGATTITSFADLRRQSDELHAWAEGDTAQYCGLNRAANPHPEGKLRDAWFAGYDCAPLPGVFVDETVAGTRVTRLFGRHEIEMLSRPRRVRALRAQCGKHAWSPGPARHRLDGRSVGA